MEFYPTPDVKQCVLASGSRVVRISTNSVTISQPTLCVMSLLRGDEEGEEGAKSAVIQNYNNTFQTTHEGM